MENNMFNQENSTDEILDAILKDRPLDEQVKILRNLYSDALGHGWVDEELRDTLFSNACKEYDIPYTSMEDDINSMVFHKKNKT
jgi:hypothetical protein